MRLTLRNTFLEGGIDEPHEFLCSQYRNSFGQILTNFSLFLIPPEERVAFPEIICYLNSLTYRVFIGSLWRSPLFSLPPQIGGFDSDKSFIKLILSEYFGMRDLMGQVPHLYPNLFLRKDFKGFSGLHSFVISQKEQTSHLTGNSTCDERTGVESRKEVYFEKINLKGGGAGFLHLPEK